MKSDIHPQYVETQVTCTCGNTFTTRSTAVNGAIHADICSQCHPFYTGKQRILDTGGRVARFEQRFGKQAASRGKGSQGAGGKGSQGAGGKGAQGAGGKGSQGAGGKGAQGAGGKGAQGAGGKG